MIALYLLVITNLEKELDGMYYLSFSVAFFCIFKVGANIYLLIPIGAVFMIKTLIKNFVIEKQKLNKPMWIMLLITAIYLLLPFHEYNAQSIVKSLMIIVLFIVLEFFILNKNKLNSQTLFYTFSIGIILSSAYALLYHVSPYLQECIEIFTYDSYFRFSGLLEHPNPFGILCIVSISLLAYLFFTKDKKIFTLALMGITTIIGIFTLSKAFLLMMVAVFGLMWLIYMKENWKKGLIVLGVCIGVAVFGYLVLHETINVILLRFISSFSDKTNEGFNLAQITSGRTDLWALYMGLWIKSAYSIIFGYGLGTPDINDLSVHNMFLAVLYEIGLVGAILFFGLLIYQIVRLLKSSEIKFHFSMLLPIVVVILFSLSEDTLFFLF